MPDYQRLAYAETTFRDAAGAVIAYGDRWPDQPDTDSYSRCEHPERFAPLVDVARALTDHLTATYRVTVDNDRSELRSDIGVTEVTRLVPDNPDGAPLTLAITTLPGVEVRAGAHLDHLIPDCGCDACDDDIDELVAHLESEVFSVANGQLEGSSRRRWQPWERR